MKNRRFALIAFLLCATLIVSVGYAAVADTLTVDGKASFTPGPATDYAAEVHFTGVSKVVNPQHIELPDQTAIIPAVQKGDQTAILSATFNTDNIAPFQDDTQYKAGVIYEIEVVCPENAESITVTFESANVSGTVGSENVPTGANFIVHSYLRESENDSPEVTTVTVGKNEGTKTVYLHVQLILSATNLNVEIPDTDFDVLLPITSVEIATE